LVLVARDRDRLASTAAALHELHGVSTSVLAADLSTDDGCAAVEERLVASQAPIECLVNNAGLSLNKPFLRSTVADEQRLFHVHLVAVMRLTHAVLPGMVERRSGSVVNVSSASGFASVMPGSTYPPSKSWVTSFSESMGLSVGPFGVRVM